MFQTGLANQIALGVLDYLKTAPRVTRDGAVGSSGMILGKSTAAKRGGGS